MHEECSGQESNVSGTECLEDECSEQESNASGSECIQVKLAMFVSWNYEGKKKINEESIFIFCLFCLGIWEGKNRQLSKKNWFMVV